jgi:hypothetical protein
MSGSNVEVEGNKKYVFNDQACACYNHTTWKLYL